MAMDDLRSARQPTSHERQSGRPWDASYAEGPAPWDTGRPQPAIVRLASAGGFTGSVLDAGCGTGDNALHIAALGLPVLGVDVAATAIAVARARAAAAGLDAEFALADALQLGRLDRTFDTVLDSGLFHAFDDDERRDYAVSLAAVTAPGATVHVLCFGDDGPQVGPHPVSADQLRAAFDRGRGWRVRAIEPEVVEARFAPDGLPAWLASIERAA
jgi:SAM-dependent methyltransferase